MKKGLFFLLALIIINITQAQQAFTNFTSKNSIVSLADDGTKMWIGTTGGLYVRSKATGSILLTYTVDNGLPSNNINDVEVDPFGNVWVATQKGLAKFDGSSWTIYNEDDGLPSELIEGITFDLSGNIWVFTVWNYLSKLESDGTFTNFGTSNGFPSEEAQCISTGPNGNIWIGTDGGGAYDFNISSSTFTQHIGHYGSSDRVYDIITDANSEMWFAGYSGLFHFDGINYTSYSIADGLASNLSVALASDISGNIWVASSTKGVTKFDPSGINTQIYNQNNGLGHNDTDAITLDTDGNIWIGTRYGLNRYDTSSDSWNLYLVNNSLSNNKINDIKIDAQDNIWVGTEYGLCRLSGSNWSNWFVSDGLLQNEVYCLDVQGSDVWTGGAYGLSHFDGSSFSTYSSVDGVSQVQDVIINSDGSIWAATATSLIHFDGTSFTNYTTSNGLISNYCNTLAKDSEGNLWVGTEGGVSMWNGNSFTNYTTANGLAQDYTLGITITNDGDIWALSNAQISIFNGSTWSTIGFNATQEVAQSSDGYFWLANLWGIKKFDGVNVATYTVDDGLSNDVIYDVAICSDGTKWFGTNGGLIKAVCANPVPSFTNNIACLPGLTAFTNTSSVVDVTTTYTWDMHNDGTNEYTSINPTHAFDSEGPISVKLTAINGVCSVSTIQDISVYETPEVSLTPSGTVNICAGNTVEIEAYISILTPVFSDDFNHQNIAVSAWIPSGENWIIESNNNAGGENSPELLLKWAPHFLDSSFIVSPVMDISLFEDLSLNFNHAVDHFENSFNLSVRTTSDGTTWNTVWERNTSSDITQCQENIIINNSDIASPNFQIAFFYIGDSYDLNSWSIDDVTISAMSIESIDPAYSLLWSTGSTETTITVSSTDTYSLVVNNSACSYSPEEVNVNILNPIEPELCMVTVDTSLAIDKNLIVWEKPASLAIQSFNVYKEITTDNYQLIGSNLFSEVAEFIDYSSEPTIHAAKYKISSIDTCGNESALSPYHQTMNLSQAQGSQSDELVLLWNKYEDESGNFTPSTYAVYRGLDENSMILESALSGDLSSYNYNALNIVDNEKFIVVIDMPTCTPSGNRATGGPYSQSTSNIEDEGIIDIGIDYPINNAFEIYPNPFTSDCLIESDLMIRNINIYNVTGDLIRQYKDINALKFQIAREEMISGMYILEINQGNRQRLIIK